MVLSQVSHLARPAAGAGTVRSQWHPAIVPRAQELLGSLFRRVAHFSSIPSVSRINKKTTRVVFLLMVVEEGIEPPTRGL